MHNELFDETEVLEMYDEHIPVDSIEMSVEPDPTADRAEVVKINGLWFVRGYRHGSDIPVTTIGGWNSFEQHVNAELFDKDGNIVTPELAPPPLEKQNRTDIDFVANMLGSPVLSNLNDRERAVAHTHLWLRNELSKGMIWQEDGQKYNVTAQKQSFLQAQLQIGSMQVMEGAEPKDITLKWNASGRSHVPWSFSDLARLANDIHAHVEPLVVKQQNGEERIMEAESEEEVAGILEEFVIDTSDVYGDGNG